MVRFIGLVVLIGLLAAFFLPAHKQPATAVVTPTQTATKPAPSPAPAPAPAPKPRLKFGAVYGGGEIAIVNLSDDEWTSCVIELNPHGMSHGYMLEGRRVDLKPHAIWRHWMNEFTEKDGLRFDSNKYKPIKVDMTCDTDQGSLSGYSRVMSESEVTGQK